MATLEEILSHPSDRECFFKKVTEVPKFKPFVPTTFNRTTFICQNSKIGFQTYLESNASDMHKLLFKILFNNYEHFNLESKEYVVFYTYKHETILMTDDLNQSKIIRFIVKLTPNCLSNINHRPFELKLDPVMFKHFIHSINSDTVDSYTYYNATNKRNVYINLDEFLSFEEFQAKPEWSPKPIEPAVKKNKRPEFNEILTSVANGFYRLISWLSSFLSVFHLPHYFSLSSEYQEAIVGSQITQLTMDKYDLNARTVKAYQCPYYKDKIKELSMTLPFHHPALPYLHAMLAVYDSKNLINYNKIIFGQVYNSKSNRYSNIISCKVHYVFEMVHPSQEFKELYAITDLTSRQLLLDQMSITNSVVINMETLMNYSEFATWTSYAHNNLNIIIYYLLALIFCHFARYFSFRLGLFVGSLKLAHTYSHGYVDFSCIIPVAWKLLVCSTILTIINCYTGLTMGYALY